MKLALLLFVFVLIGSINSIQGGRKFYATPSPDTGCFKGYGALNMKCDKTLPPGRGDRGQWRGASKAECEHECLPMDGYCAEAGHCCCRI